MHLYESDADFDAARPGLELMREFGCSMNFLSPDEIVAMEPSLAFYKPRLVGAAHAPDDESGDAFKFTQRLAALAAERGVEFRYGTQVVSLQSNGDRIAGVVVKEGQPERPGPRTDADGRRVRRVPRLVVGTAAARRRRVDADLSGERLLGDAADQAGRRREHGQPDRPPAEDRLLATRRSHPHRRHGRAVGLRHRAQPPPLRSN